ncbi:MAG: DUF362 domain-containing protein [Nanobdellota archaeon]
MSDVFFSRKIEKILEKINPKDLGNNIGLKVHFGEKGCDTYIDPEIVKKIFDKVSGNNTSLIECNVLYKGSRTKTKDHIKTAKEHGFNFAQIDILDDEGDIKVDIDNGIVKEAKIGKGIKKYDSMIVISHFKGHILTGYGGAFKNIGMGLGSRAGKLHMHSDTKPYIDIDKCVGCGLCAENCDFDAIKINGKAKINENKCSGCAMCISTCPYNAVRIPWGGSSSEEVQKKIIDYTEAVFKLIPKGKVIYINVLENITSLCDCVGKKQEPIMKDIGFLISKDPVSIDKASLDLVDKYSCGKFTEKSVDFSIQTSYAEEKGLGEEDYDLIEI